MTRLPVDSIRPPVASLDIDVDPPTERDAQLQQIYTPAEPRLCPLQFTHMRCYLRLSAKVENSALLVAQIGKLRKDRGGPGGNAAECRELLHQRGR